MLCLKLGFEKNTSASEWTAIDGVWRYGTCFVAPYRHRRIAASSLRCGERIAFVIRERSSVSRAPNDVSAIGDVDDDAFDGALREAAAWPLNFVSLVVDHARRCAEIRSGEWGSAPLYALTRGGTLWADWDAARLYPFLRRGLDLPRAILALVEIGYPYSSQTIFEELVHLTERSVARWEAARGHLEIEYPRPVPRLRPRKIREGADVLAAFDSLMREAVGLWTDPGQIVATELSGGIDSSAVATALAINSDAPVRSYGLIMPGTDGVFQAERRDELAARFGLLDYARDCEEFLPFAADGERIGAGSTIPWSEFYYDAVAALCREARQDGVDVLFTGAGGDEISTIMPDEEPDRDIELGEDDPPALPPFLTVRGIEAYEDACRRHWPAPGAAVERSCIEAAATNADVFLRHGLWPAYPYCAPRLVNFCRSLPLMWRQGRELQRLYLRRHGCTDRVARPEICETFADVMTMALQRNASVLTSLFQESRLAASGLVDREILHRSHAAFRATGEQKWKDAFVELAVLELTVRAVEQSTSSVASHPPSPDDVMPFIPS